MSKFFNRNWKAGFTLVELIVVIAILAILAGIAIPVYSGYIKKANEAADNQLLAAVNTAFGAACLENGFNAKDVTSAKLDGDKNITGVKDVSVPADKIFLSADTVSDGFALLGARPAQLGSFDADKFQASFLKYFGENKNTELKSVTVADIEFSGGVFGIKGSGTGSAGTGAALVGEPIDNGDGTKTYTFRLANGEQVAYTISDDAIAKINASTIGKMEMGNLMDDVSGMVVSLSDAMNSGTILAGLLNATGYVLESNLSPEALEEVENGMYNGKLVLPVTKDENGQYNLEELSNAVVLLIAKNTNTSGLNQMKALLNSGADNITAALHLGEVSHEGLTDAQYQKARNKAVSDGAGPLLNSMAAFYSMATAFANSDAAEGWSVQVDGQTYDAQQYYNYVNGKIAAAAADHDLDNYGRVQAIADAMSLMNAYMYDGSNQTTQFASYASGQIDLDIAGIVAGMESVAANQGAAVSTGAVTDGYNAGSFEDILNALLGKGN